MLDKEHRTPNTMKDVPASVEFKQQITDETKVFLAPYEAKQIYMSQISNRGETFDLNIEPARQLYVEYFGGGMNSIVFQEMRESRGLAYSAGATLAKPADLEQNYIFRSQIATQNDKMVDAIHTFNDIINNMPQSEAAFNLAKEGMIARLRTERITKESVIWSYINAQELGLDIDTRAQLYDEVQKMTLKDVVDFQQKWVKDRTYYYAILGDKKELDMEALKKLGTVIELKTADIFGY
jgi:predicted Zn-dependent peptidase